MQDRDQIIARLAALEVLAGAGIAVVLASAGNDPDLSKAKAILDALRTDGEAGIAHLPEPIRKEAESILGALVGRVLRMAASLRGGGSGH